MAKWAESVLLANQREAVETLDSPGLHLGCYKLIKFGFFRVVVAVVGQGER